MIIYSPLDGDAFTTAISSNVRHCFLMTRLGKPVPNFSQYLESLDDQAEHYELVADQLERNPILAIDYLKRAFLITGNKELRRKAQDFVRNAGLESRARNSVEVLAATF